MDPRTAPTPDTLRAMLSALLDGELSPDEEAVVHEALERDEGLVAELEALSAVRLSSSAALRADEADTLLAGIMGAVAPAAVPSSEEGTLTLAQLAMDDALDDAAVSELERRLEQPGASAHRVAVEGLLASAELVHAGARAPADTPAVAAALSVVAGRVEARLADDERLGVLASSWSDDALARDEAAELDGLWGRLAAEGAEPWRHTRAIKSAEHVGEALRAAAESPVFASLAARAGGAAMQAIEAERAAERGTARAGRAAEARAPLEASAPSFVEVIWRALATVRAPLAWAGAAAALFVALRGPVPASDTASGIDGDGSLAAAAGSMRTTTTTAVTTGAPSPTRASAEAERALMDELARALPPEVPAATTDLPILADNSAVVEALDATATTVVFATETSNITIIWIAEDDSTEQGT